MRTCIFPGNVSTLVAVSLWLAAAPALAAGSADKDVLAAMDTWKQATIKKDKALFDKVYHPDLTYGHSSGLIETKAQAIEHVVGSKIIYEGIDLSEPKVSVHGNTALLTGKLEMRQRAADNTLTVNKLVVLGVFVKSGRSWQMIGRQATRPPAPTGVATPATPPAPGTPTTPTSTTPAAKKP